jgi:hypothetical protein
MEGQVERHAGHQPDQRGNFCADQAFRGEQLSVVFSAEFSR